MLNNHSHPAIRKYLDLTQGNVQIYDSHGAIELLVSHILMPGELSGLESAETLTASRPEMNILLCQGTGLSVSVGRESGSSWRSLFARRSWGAGLKRSSRPARFRPTGLRPDQRRFRLPGMRRACGREVAVVNVRWPYGGMTSQTRLTALSTISRRHTNCIHCTSRMRATTPNEPRRKTVAAATSS